MGTKTLISTSSLAIQPLPTLSLEGLGGAGLIKPQCASALSGDFIDNLPLRS